MKTLLVLNRNPYDGTDVTWNALRLVTIIDPSIYGSFQY